MNGAGKCLSWLTALTTVSLALTACTGGDVRVTTTPRSQPAARPGGPSRSVPPRPHPRPAPEPALATGDAPPAPTGVAARQPFVLVTSDGSGTVHVGTRSVRFPGTVTDAVVSPNGLDLAYVDALGNIAVGRLDGTGIRVLTATDAGVRRAQPTFEDGGSEIVFSERGRDGVWRLKEVAADGHDDLAAGRPDPTVPETAHDGGGDTVPTATWFQASHEDAAHSVLLFQHRTARGVVKVYVTDRNQRGFGASPLLAGRAPAVSPTGDRVAVIGSQGEIEVQSLPVPGRKAHPTRITWGAHPTGHLVWSPDGRRLLFSTRRDVESVSTSPARPGHNPVRVVLPHPGVASTGTVVRPEVGAFPGDPVTAALDVSRARFVDGDRLPVEESDSLVSSWADHVTLLSPDDPTAAAPAAAIAAGGPLLFVRDGRLEPGVRDEIERLLMRPHGMRPHPTVDIVGSTSAVPDRVASRLRALGLRVRRFDPRTAATDAARAVRGYSTSYVVVSRTDLPAVVSSVGTSSPVLLTDGSTMPPATAVRINRMPRDLGSPPTVYAVGQQAQAAVRSAWPGRQRFRIVDLGGPDPYANSLAAVQGLDDAPGRLAVSPAADWRDELVATMAGPALVVDERQGLGAAARSWLAASQPAMRGVIVVGGPRGLPRLVGRTVYDHRFTVRRTPTDILG